MRVRSAILLVGLVAMLPISGAAASPAWEEWQSVSGVFDLGAPRSDGSLLVAGSAALYTLTPAGDLEPFARGAGGYRDDPTAEAYLALSSGQHVASAGCDFARDDAFILRLHAPIGITRVDRTGTQTASFANVSAPGLNGIAFDTTGSFDHRLLATAPVNGKTEVFAIDCTGAVQVVTSSAPVLEGGLAVAPSTFGSFGGALIAPDELSGVIWAIAPDGSSKQVVNSGLPKGGDIGVESVAFVPKGFTKSGDLYYSDRATPGNPHPGTDHVLRISSADLVAAGVQDGDMLGATEGGASMIDVRCGATCQVANVVATPTTAHGEGHLVFTLGQQASPTPKPTRSPIATPVERAATTNVPAWLIAIAAALLAALAAALFAANRRRA
ncbi:MAG: hypothetical protein E6J20_08375 [Chloroflexi bacterium]|nr:MAG: hypothetical protein E6J20_08375 [Chloroflexota bacterium]